MCQLSREVRLIIRVRVPANNVTEFTLCFQTDSHCTNGNIIVEIVDKCFVTSAAASNRKYRDCAY